MPYPSGWLGDPPGSFAPARLETPIPANVAGSLAGEALPVMEARLGRPLRFWQRYAATRMLEVDGDGRLVWPFVLDSTPRQSGKSWLIREISLWRAGQADRFGEPQSVIHVAKDLGLARRIMSQAWRWALEVGLEARKSNGQESVVWPDGESGWLIRSQDASYGWTGSTAHVDEAWAISPEVVWEGLYPTLVERAQSQLVLHSTAHRRASALVPRVLPDWLAGAGLVLLWGAAPDADFDDPAVWRAASPHWSPGREAAMRRSRSEPGFEQQWLNVWPDVLAGPGWLSVVAWSNLACGDMPAGDPSIAVESALDGSGLAVARAVGVGEGACVQALHVDSVASMRDVVDRWAADGGQVVAGKSLMGLCDPRWQAKPVTQADFAGATAAFVDAVKSGRLSHVPGGDLDHQMPAMILKGIGSGAVLTGDRVHVARSAVWAAWAALSRKEAVFVV